VSLWWRYVLLHAFRKPRRFILTCLGLAASFAAVFFAYGISGWVEAQSSRALAAVVGDANVWVVAGAMPHMDAETGAILPRESPVSSAIEGLRRLPEGEGLARVAVGRVLLNDRPVVLYADERERRDGLVVAGDLWRRLGSRPGSALISGRRVVVEGVRETLPPGVAVTSFAVGESLQEASLTTAWLVGRVSRPVAWGRSVSTLSGVVVRDGPGDVPGAPAVVQILEGSVSRFDPFSFRTKFSALMLGTSMGTVFGVLARVVFLLGVGLAGSSAGIGLWERRAELAVFAVNGLQSGVTVLFLLDALLLNGLAALLGALLATAMLKACLPSIEDQTILGHMLGIGAAYVPLLIAVSTLIPAQLVAVRHPGRLARRAV
jgi:hypothetical protein